VWDQRAAQEAEDPLAQRGALVVAEPWNLAGCLGDVLDVLEQLLVFLAEGFGGTHRSSLSDPRTVARPTTTCNGTEPGSRPVQDRMWRPCRAGTERGSGSGGRDATRAGTSAGCSRQGGPPDPA
jgi:hypothetical protein